MRHRKKLRKLGKDSAHRAAMFNNMFSSLLEHKRIKTTEAKGKGLLRYANRLLEKAKKKTLSSRREVSSHIVSKRISLDFFQNTLPKISSRVGGHVRMLRLGHRDGDGAPMVLLELITEEAASGKE